MKRPGPARCRSNPVPWRAAPTPFMKLLRVLENRARLFCDDLFQCVNLDLRFERLSIFMEAVFHSAK